MRQYIGARYVPKFMGTYDATQVYEALSVVDNGLGTSYISKVPTPANTPLTDTDYWAIYGASSGAIINLQNQIDTINSDITNIENVLDPVAKDYDLRANRFYIFIGDSYWDSNYGAIASHIADYLQLDNDQWLDAHISGSSYGAGTGVQGYEYSLTTAAASMTDDEKNAVTDIIVLGGANDCAFTSAQILTAMASFISTANSIFPNAKVYNGFICAAWETRSGGIDRNINLQEQTYMAYLEGRRYGFINLPNLEFVLHNGQYMMADGIHPNNDGGAAIGRACASALNKGASVMYVENESTLTDVNNIIDNSAVSGIVSGVTAISRNINASDGQLIVTVHDEITCIKSYCRFDIALTSANNINFSAQLVLAKVNTWAWKGKTATPIFVPIVFTDSSNQEIGRGMGAILNNTGQWYLRVTDINGGAAVTGVSHVIIMPFEVNIPTFLA